MNPVNTKPYNLPADATWLITGCSSGIGRALAEHVSTHPTQRLIATARDPSALSYLPENSPNILKIPLDVTSPSSVSKAFTSIIAHFGPSFHLDVLVNNAGYSLSGDTENATEEETHQEIETLFFGTARVTTAALKYIRPSEKEEGEARGGLVMNISSLAGLCAFPGHAYYHAGKFAVEGWTESVAREMHPDWNISFCIVEPSGVKTNFEGHSKANIKPHPAYAAPDMPARKLEVFVKKGIEATGGKGLMAREAIAETIWKIASSGERIPLRLPLGLTTWRMAKMKYEGALQELENMKEISAMGQEA